LIYASIVSILELHVAIIDGIKKTPNRFLIFIPDRVIRNDFRFPTRYFQDIKWITCFLTSDFRDLSFPRPPANDSIDAHGIFC
jgi:hypothetical protein